MPILFHCPGATGRIDTIALLRVKWGKEVLRGCLQTRGETLFVPGISGRVQGGYRQQELRQEVTRNNDKGGAASRCGKQAPLVAMDDFLIACGSTGPLQLVVERLGHSAIRWNTLRPFARIGRDPGADLCLDDPQVAGWHVYLQIVEGGIFWVDLGSPLGTRYPGARTPFGWLIPPNRLEIGPYLVQVAPDDQAAVVATHRVATRLDPFLSRAAEIDDLPPVVLEFRRESARPLSWRMRHVLTLVGSSTVCKVRLTAPGVAPFHCSLLRTRAGIWAVNLAGNPGLIVNGTAVTAARLTDGDELTVGEVLVRVRLNNPTTEPGPGSKPGLGSGIAIPKPQAFLAHPLLQTRELMTGPQASGWTIPANPGEPSLRAEPMPLSQQGEVPTQVLGMVLDQFGQMQQNFLEQFQQTTLMMFQASRGHAPRSNG